jgi:glycosyltransferase involved in cell wall biosynthesis
MFTIITINYNNDKGLSDSLKSISQQSILKSLIQVVVVDGDSNDNSPNIIIDNEHIIDEFIIERDSGIFDAMNKGVSLANKNYIFFLNSGDVFSEIDVLQNVFNEIKSKPNEILYKGIVNTYKNGIFLRQAKVEPWVCHQGVFLKTDVAKKYKFDDNLMIFGDLDLWFRMHKDRVFNPIDINVVICNMEMDGVGNCPLFYKKRLEDKKVFNKKHKLKSRFFIDYTLQIVSFSYYKLFGDLSYHKYFVGAICYVREKFSTYRKKSIVKS